MLHYITTLRITLFRYVAPLRKYLQGKYLPVELMFLIHQGALSIIQPETIIVVNIRSKKHPVSRKECKVIEFAGIPVKWMRVRTV